MGGGKQDVCFSSSLLKDVKWRKKSSVKGIRQAMRRKRNLYLDRVGLQGQGGTLYTDTSLQIKVDSACLTSLSLEIVIISFTSIPIFFFFFTCSVFIYAGIWLRRKTRKLSLHLRKP